MAIPLKQAGRATSSSWSGPAGRRHLAGQHLSRAAPATSPRTCTRSPSRPTPTGPRVLPPAGDPRLSRATAPTSRAAAARPLRRRGHSRPAGTRPPSAGSVRTATAARSTADVLVLRHRAAVEPAIPSSPGSSASQGTVLPLRALGPRLRPERQAGRRDRHRRLGDPVRPADPAPGRPADPLPAHPAVGHAPPRPAIPERRARRLRQLPAAQRLARRVHLLGAGAARALGVHQAPEADEARRAARRPTPRRAGEGPGAARQAHPRLPHRLQAHPALQRLLPGARPSPTSTSSPPGIAEVRGALDRAPPTAPRARSTRSSSAPASTSPTCRSPTASAAATGTTSTEPGRDGDAALPGHRPSPASPTCSSSRAQHRARPHSIIFMIESQLRYMIELPAAGTPAAGRAIEAQPDGAGTLQRRRAAAVTRTRVDHGRLRQLVPRLRGRQPFAVAGLPTVNFWLRMRRVRPADFILEGAAS